MTADVAMTKRGFGEMAITGCIAGPIFNVLIGLGLSNTLSIIKSDKGIFDKSNVVGFSMYTPKGDLNKEAILPLTLIITEIVVLFVILINGLINKYKIDFKFSMINTIIYSAAIIFLVTFSIT